MINRKYNFFKLFLRLFFCDLNLSLLTLPIYASVNYTGNYLTGFDEIFLLQPPLNSFIQANFVTNKPILKSYGPLTLDINNINFEKDVFIIPMLNINSKPLFLAINCENSIFNVKAKSLWKGWFDPFFTYELEILSDFCDL